MALTINNINLSKLVPTTQNTPIQNRATQLPGLTQTEPGSINFSLQNDPTALILQSAMEKISAQFAPHLGEGALQKATESGQDMSPQATADRILSFATQLFGRAEADQVDLPVEEQRSRERLFDNIKTGVENGFEQARSILEGMQALDGEVKETVNATYDAVQQGLTNLSTLLGLNDSPQSVT